MLESSLESSLESWLRKRVKALGHGSRCLKFVSPGFSGVPDRMILLPGGHLIFVEMKKPKEKERKRQEYVQKLLRDLGFEVYSSVNTMDRISEVIDRCKEVLRDEGLQAP